MAFIGFPRATLDFLAGIAANNNKDWFAANRALYDASTVAAKALVEAVGPGLTALSPTLQYEAKIGASLPRVNNDTRLAKDKPPYKTNLDLWFWHGERKSFEEPGFFLRLTPEGVWVAAGMMHIMPPALYRFREAVVAERSGSALVDLVARIEAAGPYEVGYPKRKSLPKGYSEGTPRADYLLYESLWGHLRLPAEAVLSADFADVALGAWRDLAPITLWLLDEVAAR